MIITGGENVYSKEVEDPLYEHPKVTDVAIIGVPHPEWGETVGASGLVRGRATGQGGGALLGPGSLHG